MRTGLSKKQKTTSVFFDEASPIIEVCTYNTSLKKRLSEYAAKYPVECRLVDDDENGCLTFEIRKGRFSFKLNAPSRICSKARSDDTPPVGRMFPCGRFFLFLMLMFL